MDWLKELFGFALPIIDQAPVIRALVGFILVFFLPGFAWTLVFFRQVTAIERIALSFGLSIAIVALGSLSVNQLLGINITGINALLGILVVTAIPAAIYLLRRLAERH